MNLKKLLSGNAEQLLTSKDYRIAAQLRVHAGRLLIFTTPLIALGALLNTPALAIPALYIPSALTFPQLNYLLLKTVPRTNQSRLSALKTLMFNPLIGIILMLFCGEIFYALFDRPNWSERHQGLLRHELHFQATHYWYLVLFGVGMTVLCGWLALTLMKGRRTQAMQRIAAHLTAQEADNA